MFASERPLGLTSVTTVGGSVAGSFICFQRKFKKRLPTYHTDGAPKTFWFIPIYDEDQHQSDRHHINIHTSDKINGGGGNVWHFKYS